MHSGAGSSPAGVACKSCMRNAWGVKRSIPGIFAELRLKPLRFFWWEQSSEGTSLLIATLVTLTTQTYRTTWLMLSSTMPAKFAVTVTLHPQVLEGTRCWRGFEGLGQLFVGHSRFWPVLPRAAPSVGVVTCTYEQRFRPLN